MSQPPRKAAPRRERIPRRGVAVNRPVPKPSQRERLIDAIIELSGQHGYQSLSIAQISARAGVSSATFYELFADREGSLLAAYRAVTRRALARMELAREAGEWSKAVRPAFGELVRVLQADPDAGRVMFVEAITGGPKLREEVLLVSNLMERTAEQLLDSAPPGGETLDVPARALQGAVHRVVARHLRTHSEDRLTELSEDILAWMSSYTVPAEQGRWSTGPEALLPAVEPVAADENRMPAELSPLPRGRHGLPAAVVARSQRMRIIYATAMVTTEKGYANTTVADIVAAAGVAKEAFYRHFSDKEQAFLDAQQHPAQHIVDELVQAYFSVEEWPRRLWSALRRMLELIAENPTFSRMRMVEAYAAGLVPIRRAEDIMRSFSIFLEEGYRYRAAPGELPRIYSTTIPGALFEMIQHEVGDGRTAQMPTRLPQLAYVALAPFTGPDEAVRLVRELREEELGGTEPAAA
ncbi:MAG: TetR/AcrR family transcriptional regulator [Solirubrobacteraceae bacterium]